MPFRLLLSFLILVCASPARAQWVLDGAPVSATVFGQDFPRAAPDGAGGAIITWQDTRNSAGGGNYDIYAQRIDAAGVAKWTVDGVAICSAMNGQYFPKLVADGAGGAIIAWEDQRGGGSDVYAQRVNANGVTLWTANGVLLSAVAFNEDEIVIASDGTGGAIVAWRDHRIGIADIYARRVNAMGFAEWAANGVALCTAASPQNDPVIASDGAGGAIVTWEDDRGSSTDIYAQRIGGSGMVQWAANGVALCAASNQQITPVIAGDGGNGAVIAWQDRRGGTVYDIYAQRVSSVGTALWTLDGVWVSIHAADKSSPAVTWDNTSGAIISWYDYRAGQADIYAQRVSPAGSPRWLGNGIGVCLAAGQQFAQTMISDGAGGAVIAWADQRSAGPSDVYAQRVDATGLAKWASNGVALCTVPASRGQLFAVADGTGGAVVTWYESRNGASSDVYAQHVEGRYGYWGRPDPSLFAVKDVPADQGGKVRLEWYASQRDQLNQQVITQYTIWRAIDQAAFALASASGVPEMKLADISTKLSGKAIRHEKAQAVDYFWELIGQQEAIYRYAYSFNASTSFDSTAANPATHRFQVVAHSFSQFVNWPSNVLSGRSVDNLAPTAPLMLTAQRIGNYVYLKWNGVHVPDLDKYTVYRATSSGVTPIAPNFLADDNDTLLTDTGAPASALYYIVTAKDVHQNQSAPSNEASVGAATSTGNLPPITALMVLQNHPNPFTGETQLQVGLPSRSDVRVDIYDVAGRRVRTALFPQQAKGWSSARLDALDDRGQLLASGVYFYRVHAGSETVTRKMVIAR